MKTNYLTFLLIFSVCFGFAQTKDSLSVEEQQRREKNIQAGNPFKKFGYTPKIATLSKGKYLEFHDLDSIVKIGSFSYHVKKKSITGFTKLENQNTEAGLSPEIISRWMSPDPLSDEFPSWSPYTAMNDNPINFIDPDGRASLWIPDVNGDGSTSYIAEAGDSANTLASQYGISQTKAEKITGTTGDTKIAEGTEVAGQTVKDVTGSEVLKLDLNSKEGKSSQRRFDQFLFARDHSNSKGAYAFLSTDYYSKTMIEEISGRATMTLDGNQVGVLYNIPLYRAGTFDGSSTSVALSNEPIQAKPTSGRSFPNQANVELPLYHPNTGGRMGHYSIYINGKNSNSVMNRLSKDFPLYNYINTTTKTKN